MGVLRSLPRLLVNQKFFGHDGTDHMGAYIIGAGFTKTVAIVSCFGCKATRLQFGSKDVFFQSVFVFHKVTVITAYLYRYPYNT